MDNRIGTMAPSYPFPEIMLIISGAKTMENIINGMLKNNSISMDFLNKILNSSQHPSLIKLLIRGINTPVKAVYKARRMENSLVAVVKYPTSTSHETKPK